MIFRLTQLFLSENTSNRIYNLHLLELGASKVGYADVDGLASEFVDLPNGISLVLKLPKEAMRLVEDEDYNEISTYYNTDGSVKYIIHHKYNSSVKSVERETYFYADGTTAYTVDHGKDKIYYIFAGDVEELVKGNELANSKFYSEIDDQVHQLLGIKK